MIAVGKSFYCMHIILNGEGNIPIEFNKSFMWALPAITTRKTLTSSAGFLAISSAGRRATATVLQLFFSSSAGLAQRYWYLELVVARFHPALLIIIYSA